MARKARNYKAEEQSRNALAKQRGFTNRAQQRYALKTGARSPKLTPQAREYVETKGHERLGSVFDFGRENRTERAHSWSAMFARTNMAKFNPSEAQRLGFTEKQYTDAYLAAFVTGEQRYVEVRRRGGSEALRHWFVDIKHVMSADEYETRYGQQK